MPKKTKSPITVYNYLFLRVYILKKYTRIFLSGLIVLFFTACKKDHKILGVDVQPKVDELHADYLASSPVLAYSEKYDSIGSLNTRYKYLGYNEDSHFGKTEIGLYTNAVLNVVNLDFGPTATLTTAEIILVVDNVSYMGDANASLTYTVFPISTQLNPNTVYYSNNDKLYDKTQQLGTHTTSFTTYGGKPAIRITLDSTFGSTVLNNAQYLTNNDVFQTQYKGFYILASAGAGSEGVIYTADLDDDFTGFYLRYKTGTAATDTMMTFRFPFKGTNSTKFNTMKFTPKGALQNQLQGDTTLAATNLYLKGMGGTRLKVKIPFLKNYSDTLGMAVNRAEIIFDVDQGFTWPGQYAPPPKLALLPLDSLGRETVTEDQKNTTDLGRYSGSYDATNKRYVFNIARHAQAILRGEVKNYGFHLVVADPEFPAVIKRDEYMEQVVLVGTGHASLKPRLNLSYIRFQND